MVFARAPSAAVFGGSMRGKMQLGFNLLGFVVFAYFAWLQREDDNPAIYANPSLVDVWAWIVFYGLIALLFLLGVFRRFPWPLFAVAVAFCVFELAATGPGLIQNLTGGEFTMTKKSMNPGHAEVEQSREFFGAVIALLGSGFLWWQRSLVSKPASR